MNWKLINFCEFDKYAVKSYCAIHNVDESLNLGDITKVNENEIADFNMICGGSPCQDFSISGKQKGSVWECNDCGHTYNPLTVHYSQREHCPHCHGTSLNKSRSSLLVEFLRIVRGKRPDFGIYENVKNIVGRKFKDTFNMFTGELNEYGYNVHYKVLNAKDYGVPQNRERVYLVFIKKKLDNGKFEFPQGFDNGIRLIDILEQEVDEKYYISDEKVERFLTDLNKNASYTAKKDSAVQQISNIVHTGHYNNPQRGCIYAPSGCSPALNCVGGGGLEPKVLTVGKLSTSQDSVIVSAYGVAPTHTAGHGNCPKVAFPLNPSDDGTCRTIKAQQSKNTLANFKRSDSFEATGVLEDKDNIRIRKLTPKECFRLMGFEDKDWQAAVNAGISNSQLYKQAGNSIVVDVLYYIFVELYKAMPYLFDDLKLSSFFSGIGAFEKALDRLYKDINVGNYPQKNYIKNTDKPKLVGGIGSINYGKQYRQGNRVYDSRHISMCLTASPLGNTGGHSYLYAIRGRYNQDGSISQKLEPRTDGYTNTLTTVQKDNIILELDKNV